LKAYLPLVHPFMNCGRVIQRYSREYNRGSIVFPTKNIAKKKLEFIWQIYLVVA
jgi:hypothetical protein